MSVNLSPLGGAGAQFFTNDGVPLTGGLLYTYLAGTSTPATTYTSSNGLTALANPIILDAAGRVPTGEIWLADGISYKFVLKDSTDVLIATWDGLSGINSNFIAFTAQEETATATAGQTVFNLSLSYLPATNNLSVFVNGSNQIVSVNYLETDDNTVTFLTGLNVGDVVKFSTATPVATNAMDAANVSYTPAGAGAVTTNVQAKLRQTVSVKDFGAVGDGTTDDTAAFNAALTTGKPIYIPSGAYVITSELVIPSANIEQVIYGDGIYSSVLLFTNATGGLNFTNVVYARPQLTGFGIVACNAGCTKALYSSNYDYAIGNNAYIDISIAAGGQNNVYPTGIWDYGIWFNNFQSSQVKLSAYQSCVVAVHGEGYWAAVDFISPNIVGAPTTQRAFEFTNVPGTYVEKNYVVNIYGGVLQGPFSASVVNGVGATLRIYDTFIENSDATPSDGADIVYTLYYYNNIISGVIFSQATLSILTVGTPGGSGHLEIIGSQVYSVTLAATDGKVSITNTQFNATSNYLNYTAGYEPNVIACKFGASGTGVPNILKTILTSKGAVAGTYMSASSGLFAGGGTITIPALNTWVGIGAGDVSAVLSVRNVAAVTASALLAIPSATGVNLGGNITGIAIRNNGGDIELTLTSGTVPATLSVSAMTA
jgi:hypothetical protein